MSHNLSPELRPVGPPLLSQKIMREYLTLETNFKILKARYEEEQERLLHLLQAGVPQEDGFFVAELHPYETRRPKWKAFFIQFNGQAEADQIIENTRPSITYTPVINARPTIITKE